MSHDIFYKCIRHFVKPVSIIVIYHSENGAESEKYFGIWWGNVRSYTNPICCLFLSPCEGQYVAALSEIGL